MAAVKKTMRLFFPPLKASMLNIHIPESGLFFQTLGSSPRRAKKKWFRTTYKVYFSIRTYNSNVSLYSHYTLQYKKWNYSLYTILVHISILHFHVFILHPIMSTVKHNLIFPKYKRKTSAVIYHNITIWYKYDKTAMQCCQIHKGALRSCSLSVMEHPMIQLFLPWLCFSWVTYKLYRWIPRLKNKFV